MLRTKCEMNRFMKMTTTTTSRANTKNSHTKWTFQWTFSYSLKPIASNEQEIQSAFIVMLAIRFSFVFSIWSNQKMFASLSFGFFFVWFSKWVLWVDLHKFACQNWYGFRSFISKTLLILRLFWNLFYPNLWLGDFIFVTCLFFPSSLELFVAFRKSE